MQTDRPEGAPFPPPHDPNGADHRPPPPPPPAENLPPWEDRDNHGVVGGLLGTIRRAMTSPGRFFDDHPVDRGWLGPVSFYVLLAVLAAAAGWLWSTTFSGVHMGMLGVLEEFNMDDMTDVWLIQFITTFGVVISPLTALFELFLYAGAFHLGVMILVPGNRGFEATLRAVAYAGAAQVLAWVPFCGELIMDLWLMALAMIAIHRIHRCDAWRAVVVVIAPLVIFFCGCVSLTSMFTVLASA